MSVEDTSNGRVDQSPNGWNEDMETLRARQGFETRGSPAMQRVFLQMTGVRSDSNVLITGKSGTGKTHAAHVIHLIAHGQTNQKFFEVNIASLDPQLIASELFGHERWAFSGADRARTGRFEAASSGSLLIDEIGEIPRSVQVKILSALDMPRRIARVGSNDTLHPQVLVICATTRNLARLVERNEFNEALYRRLQQRVIHMPSLQQRGPEYIGNLVKTLLQREATERNCAALDIDDDALSALKHRNYPGNLRDLHFLLSEMCNHAYKSGDKCLLPMHLSHAIESRGVDDTAEQESFSFNGLTLKQITRIALVSAVNRNRTIAQAAKELGIDRSTLHHKMQKLQIPGRRASAKKYSE